MRWSYDRLIFIMKITILVKTVFILGWGPGRSVYIICVHLSSFCQIGTTCISPGKLGIFHNVITIEQLTRNHALYAVTFSLSSVFVITLSYFAMHNNIVHYITTDVFISLKYISLIIWCKNIDDLLVIFCLIDTAYQHWATSMENLFLRGKISQISYRKVT